MSKYDSILVEKKGHIGYVYFNNPQSQNRVGRKESIELAEAFKEVDEDTDIHAVILSGKGDYFCSGGKIDGFPDGSIIEQREYAQAIVASLDAMAAMSKPIIAAVNATTLAGGIMFMEACDLAVAGKDCMFGLPEIQRGYFPMIALAVLQKAMPKKRLMELALTGEMVTADAMMEWNLINKVVENSEVMKTAEAIAEKIAGYNTMSIKFGRSCYYKMSNMNLANSMAYSQTELLNLLWTHDARETAHAAEEGRAPRYIGR